MCQFNIKKMSSIIIELIRLKQYKTIINNFASCIACEIVFSFKAVTYILKVITGLRV
jgi:hypothetical protein